MNVVKYFYEKYNWQEPFTALIFEGKTYSTLSSVQPRIDLHWV